MADISKEIQNFRSARRGKDVRGSMISLAEKVNKETTDAKAAAVNAAADAGVAASNASYAVNQANTAAQNANTAAQNIQTRADRGDFTGTIRIGEVTTGEPGSEATASNSGSAKDAVINLTIPQGYQGVSMRMAGAWTAGTEYVNNTSYIDLVTYNGGTYGCKQTHTASEDTTPTLERNEYWQVIAKKGDTGGIENIDTTPIEFKEAAERENIESGDSIPTMGGKIRKWFSDFKQAAFMNVVNGVTQSVAGQAVLDAAVGKYLDEKKLDISRIVANRNITELGFAMDGKTAADWLNELNGNMNTISRGNSFKIWSIGEWKNSGGNFPGNYGVIIRTLGYSRPGYFAGDSYFLAIVYTGLLDIPSRLYSGSMINQEQEVTWIPYVLTSDLGYTDVTMDTVRGSNNYVPNITGMNYIPVVLRVSSDYTGVSVYGNRGANSWLVISPTEQNMTIRFYKYPA